MTRSKKCQPGERLKTKKAAATTLMLKSGATSTPSNAVRINPKHQVDTKPHTHQVNLRHLHPALVKRLVPRLNWVNWRWELNGQNTGWTKVPYQVRSPNNKAAPNNEKHWG